MYSNYSIHRLELLQYAIEIWEKMVAHGAPTARPMVPRPMVPRPMVPRPMVPRLELYFENVDVCFLL